MVQHLQMVQVMNFQQHTQEQVQLHHINTEMLLTKQVVGIHITLPLIRIQFVALPFL